MKTGSDAFRYTTLQITAHWAVVLLVISQWLTSASIHRTHSLLPPKQIDLFLHAVHNYGGMAIGALVVLRIFLRLVSPRPLPPQRRDWRSIAAAIVHWGLYGSLLAEAGTGFITSYFWGPLGGVHRFIWNITLALVVVHVLAAGWHAMRGDGVIGRIFPTGRSR